MSKSYTTSQLKMLRTWIRDTEFYDSLSKIEQDHVFKAFHNVIYGGTSVKSVLVEVRKKWLLHLTKNRGYSWWDIDNMIKNGKKEKV